MKKMNLFPKFPKVQDTPPKLEEIEAGNPNFAIMFWGLLFLATSLLSAWVGVKYVYPSSTYALWTCLSLGIFTCYMSFSAMLESSSFDSIDEKSTSSSWTCDEVAKFFEENPEFSSYYASVLNQGRPFYVGEMRVLSERSRKMRESYACKTLYQVNG